MFRASVPKTDWSKSPVAMSPVINKERERAALLQGYYDPQRRQAELNQLSSHLLGLCDELRDEARDQGKTDLRQRAQQVTDTMFEVFEELDAINHELAKSSSDLEE